MINRLLLVLAISCHLASAQGLGEFHQILANSNADLESSFQKYKKSLSLDWMDAAVKKKTLADLEATHAAWKIWAAKEAEFLGVINGEGVANLIREESLSSLIDLVDARTRHFHELARGFKLPPAPSANDQVIQPKPGQELRTALCDTFRPIIASEAKIAKPAFVISSLNVMGNWAFINCVPQNSNGSKIDWSKTKHTDIASGEIDEIAVALIAKDPNGQWKVVDYGIGASDVWWLAWIEAYQIPQKLIR